MERGHGLTRDLAHTRSADILIAGWDITSPLCSAVLSESCHQAGATVLAAEVRKLHFNRPKCQELGWSCIPLAVETYGNLLQAGVLPGHSPVLPKVISGGRDLRPVEYDSGSLHRHAEPSWPGSSHPPNRY